MSRRVNERTQSTHPRSRKRPLTGDTRRPVCRHRIREAWRSTGPARWWALWRHGGCRWTGRRSPRAVWRALKVVVTHTWRIMWLAKLDLRIQLTLGLCEIEPAVAQVVLGRSERYRSYTVGAAPPLEARELHRARSTPTNPLAKIPEAKRKRELFFFFFSSRFAETPIESSSQIEDAPRGRRAAGGVHATRSHDGQKVGLVISELYHALAGGRGERALGKHGVLDERPL